MPYRISRLAMLTLALIPLAGCSEPNAPTKANFRKAVEPLVHDAYCTPLKVEPLGDELFDAPADRPAFPLVIRRKPTEGLSDDPKARASLDDAASQGLLTRTTKTVPLLPYPGSTGPKVPSEIVAYTPTAKGKEYFRGVASRDYNGEMRSFASACLGDGKLDEIVRWTEPADAFGQKFSIVTYRFSATNIMPGMPKELVTKAEAPIERTTTLVQTNNGWQPVGG